jgi:hypothetical protein
VAQATLAQSALHDQIGIYFQQEIDILSLCKDVASYNQMILGGKRAQEVVDLACRSNSRSLSAGRESATWSDLSAPQVETHFQFPGDQESFAYATERCVGIGECLKEEQGTKFIPARISRANHRS